MKSPIGSTKSLLVSAGTMPLAVAAYIVFVGTIGALLEALLERDDSIDRLGGPPDVLPFMALALVALTPVFVAGYVRTLIALYTRRPLWRDVVGLIVCVPVLVLSAFMLYWGLTSASEQFRKTYSSGASIVLSGGVALLGVGGLVVIATSLVAGTPRQGGARDTTSPPPDERTIAQR